MPTNKSSGSIQQPDRMDASIQTVQ